MFTTTNTMASEQEIKDKENEEILFSCGMIADVQYGDADDGFNFTKTRQRRFRPALKIVKNAVKIWNGNDKNCPSFIISLGDIIDVLNSKTQPKQSQSAIKTVLTAFNQFKPTSSKKEQLLKYVEQGIKIYGDIQSIDDKSTDEQKQDNDNNNNNDNNNDDDYIPKYPFFHNLVGNHELYNFNRKELLKYMKGIEINDDIKYYYSFTPYKGYLFIMLDSYNISSLGYQYCDNKHNNYKQAEILLNKYNPNKDKHAPVPTYGYDRRFRAFNGAFGTKQLLWFEKQLKIAQDRNDNVIILTHVPIYSNLNKDYDILQWDYKEMIQIIDKYSCVKMYFAGHDHIGDLYKDKNGVIYVTFEGVVESAQNTDCFATVSFFKNKVKIDGYGMIKSNQFTLRPF